MIIEEYYGGLSMVASFFAGVGGIDLAFEQAGFKIIYANEIDKKAAETYELNFNLKVDVRDIGEINPSKLPNFNILIAGFPCQAFSIAGYRQGFNDEKGRGNLFFNIINKATPCALTIVISILSIMGLSKIINISYLEISTLCVVLTGFNELLLLFNLCTPFNKIRKILFLTMSSAFFICLIFFKNLFSLSHFSLTLTIITLILCIFSYFVFNFISKIFLRF